MIRTIVFAFVAATLLSSCDINGEREILRAQKDSLEAELIAANKAVSAIEQVGILMDSIDKNRDVISMEMEEGLTYENFVSRMGNLNDYVKQSENKLKTLEEELAKSEGAKGTYAAAIKRLKADLAGKNKEITELQSTVASMKVENQELVSTVALQEAQLADADIEIMQKKQELELIENRIQELMVQSKMNEADAFFARGQAVEDAAARTKLAPKKRKETYEDALTLYRKAYDMGRADAKAKIDELTEKLK